MSLDHLSTLVDFIKEQNKIQHIPNSFLFTKDDFYYIENDEEVISCIVNIACQENKRIHSEKIEIAIEELSSRWEVSR